MLEENFQQYQLDLIRGFVPEAVEVNDFLQWGNTLLSIYKKTRTYLRAEANNPYWIEVKTCCLDQLADMAKMIPGHLNDVLLEARQRGKILDFSAKVTQVMYEEKRADENGKGKPKVNVAANLDQTHIKAFERLLSQTSTKK